ALDWLDEWNESKRLTLAAERNIKQLSSPLLDARLAQALGRSACRFNQDREGIDFLRGAARIAEQVGDDAYEVLVTSNVHLGFALPFVGCLAEAEERLQKVIRLCEEKGDDFHLCSAYNNRSCLWLARDER